MGALDASSSDPFPCKAPLHNLHLHTILLSFKKNDKVKYRADKEN
jgi:hypothetical protein